ncbi:putative glycosyltransferase EpsD [Lachnospiraceae bacterium]|nr:putative glycosyltransferase EpsD [Lachnospiraceae bacterium]
MNNNGKAMDVTLLGYIKSEHGVGESARHVASALDKTGYKWDAYDFEINNLSRQQDEALNEKITEEVDGSILIMNVNADQTPVVKEHLPAEQWNRAYKIGIWYWELPVFPERWLPSINLVDEIWAPTRFVQDAVSMKANCPVIYMPLPMELKIPKVISREKYGLPKDAFLFVNMYDTLSMQSRKNPTAVIEAFKKTFRPDDLSVGLVVKLNNSNVLERDYEYLKQIKGQYQNIYFLPKVLDRIEVNELIMMCDVAVSLHRSEGLGLLCQEAMYLGKPVIATNWSGNVDFMSDREACMVNYKLIHVGEDIGPYESWQEWADADVDHASELMGRLYADRSLCAKLGENARKRIMDEYSSDTCGKRMRSRIEFIKNKLL